MLLPVWNHPTEVVDGAPVPQATACANSGQNCCDLCNVAFIISTLLQINPVVYD